MEEVEEVVAVLPRGYVSLPGRVRKLLILRVSGTRMSCRGAGTLFSAVTPRAQC